MSLPRALLHARLAGETLILVGDSATAVPFICLPPDCPPDTLDPDSPNNEEFDP